MLYYMVRMRFKVKTEPGLKTEENSNVFNELGAILNVFSQLGYVSERYMYFITSKRKSQAKAVRKLADIRYQSGSQWPFNRCLNRRTTAAPPRYRGGCRTVLDPLTPPALSTHSAPIAGLQWASIRFCAGTAQTPAQTRHLDSENRCK